jgi:hypothetical protein
MVYTLFGMPLASFGNVADFQSVLKKDVRYQHAIKVGLFEANWRKQTSIVKIKCLTDFLAWVDECGMFSEEERNTMHSWVFKDLS